MKIESGVSGYEEKGPHDRPIAITTDRELYTIPDEWLKHRMTEYNERVTAKSLKYGVLYTRATVAVLTQPMMPLAQIAEKYLFTEKQIERCRFLDKEWGRLLRNSRRGIIETHAAPVNEDHFIRANNIEAPHEKIVLRDDGTTDHLARIYGESTVEDF